MELLIILYIILFAFIVWRRLDYGLFLFFFLLPTYLIRFHIGFLPMNLLEAKFWILFISFILQRKKTQPLQTLKGLLHNHKNFVYASLLFGLAATLSLWNNDHLSAAAGEWKAFYIEPMLFSFMLISFFSPTKKTNDRLIHFILFPLILSGLFTALLGIYQHFTGWMVPWDFWENRDTFRVTAWYGFPNAVGLFLAPLYPFGIYMFFHGFHKWKRTAKISLPFIFSFIFLLLTPFALVFAKGSGPIIALTAGIGCLLLSHKKTRKPALLLAVIGIVGIFFLPTDSLLKQEIFMKNRSGQIRVQMWGETVEYLLHHPITGTRLASYQTELWPYRYDKWIEIFHHPHNIFLTLWVNLGFLGIFTFLWILVDFFFMGVRHMQLYKRSTSLIPFILSAMIVFVVSGLVDSPYIKNDLSFLFWSILALSIIVIHDSKYA